MTQPPQPYDCIVIGGGAVGTADTYALAKYSNLTRIALIEKEPWWARINSASTSNSQSLHRGYYETNFSPEKTKKLKIDGGWVQGFVERHPGIGVKGNAMVIGVGDAEVEALSRRYGWAKDLFPDLELLTRREIAAREPEVMRGRDPRMPITALATKNAYTVDYGKLSAAFVDEARAVAGKTIDTILDQEVTRIERTGHGTYRVHMDGQTLEAKAVIVSAGAHSLRFAQSLGYAKHLIELPVAGNFYYAPERVIGKVYTVQREGLPFAAVHGDPDLAAPGKTRFGPTAVFLPVMERGDWWSALDYLGTVKRPLRALRSVRKILTDKTLLGFMRENLRYLGPHGTRNFLPHARKVIPTLREEDLTVARDAHGDDIGGLRPQVVDTTTGEMQMGESKITGRDNGDRLIFNVTPSPGASVCLANALRDATLLEQMLPGYVFDRAAFERDHQPSM